MVLLFFDTPLELVAISFGYYLWGNVAVKTKRKIDESLIVSFYSVWKSKKELAGYDINTNDINTNIVGTPFQVRVMEIQTRGAARRYAWSWMMYHPVRGHQNF